MSWHDLLIVYVILCAGFGLGQGWEGGGEAHKRHRLSETFGNGLLVFIASPLIPFILVWSLYQHHRAKRAHWKHISSGMLSVTGIPGVDRAVTLRISDESWRALKPDHRQTGAFIHVQYSELDSATQIALLDEVESVGAEPD